MKKILILALASVMIAGCSSVKVPKLELSSLSVNEQEKILEAASETVEATVVRINDDDEYLNTLGQNTEFLLSIDELDLNSETVENPALLLTNTCYEKMDSFSAISGYQDAIELGDQGFATVTLITENGDTLYCKLASNGYVEYIKDLDNEYLYENYLSYEEIGIIRLNAEYLEDILGWSDGEGYYAAYTLVRWAGCGVLADYENKESGEVFNITLIDSNGNKFYTAMDDNSNGIGPIQKDDENGEYLYAPIE